VQIRAQPAADHARVHIKVVELSVVAFSSGETGVGHPENAA